MSTEKLMLDTVLEVYPKYLKTKVIQKLIEQCIISTEPDLLTEAETTGDVAVYSNNESDSAEFEIISKAIHSNSNTLSVIESLEYEKTYKYSTLLSMEGFPLDRIRELISTGQILDTSEKDFTSDYCSSFDKLDIIKPSYKEFGENLSVLKFNEILKGHLPANGKSISVRYPILVLFFKDLNIVEIRLDSVKGYLKNDDFFYSTQIDKILEWLESYLMEELSPVNLRPVIDFISKKNSKEVDVAAQAMNMKSGSKAILDTGVNDSPVLPLLGELKELIEANIDLFNANDQTKEIEEKLNYFIKETEETSDLPWISLRWNHNTKSKAIKVKFSFSYKGQVYDLLQYYGNNAELGEMNNVTKYLSANKKEYDISELESEETGEIA